MQNKNSSIINVALVGGGTYCREFLEKTCLDYRQSEVNARIVAVADPDPESPGMVTAKQLGLTTLNDYHDLYHPAHNIHLITILTPDPDVLQDVLETKPTSIRALAFHAFELFWKAIRLEEEKLREQNKEMETVLNGIQDFILVITPEREVVEVNESFLKFMNYSRKRVIGKKCYDVFNEVTRKSSNCHLVCPLKKALINNRPCQEILTRLGPDNKPRYTELTIFPIWEKDGRISKFIEISRDITKRKLEEEELTGRLEKMVEERTHQLKETHEKLLHQDKMASLGKLSASVVHEINNPIAGILNLTVLMRRILEEGDSNPEDLERFKEYLDLMNKETRRISKIVSNLLAFSRQSKMEIKQIDLNRLVERILLLNSNLLKLNGVGVEKIFNPTLPPLLGSEDQLQQVIMNLVSNAVESMAPLQESVLSIETSHSLNDNYVMIRMKDTGSGITPEDLPKLFEPFFTTKKRGKGVGLGLSVAYGIIKEHGGNIHVDSKIGKGTTFEITLPLNLPMGTDSRKGGGNGQHQNSDS